MLNCDDSQPKLASEEEKESRSFSDTNSDFEIIDEADDEAAIMSLSADSALSAMSAINLVQPAVKGVQRPRAPSSCANLLEDLSESSSLMYKEVDLSPGVRAYKHTPNKKVNVKLNLIVAFTLTAVIFLGVGNYIGWSDNLKSNQLTASQISKLKHLQDELVHCMQDQDKAESSTTKLKICNQNSDYWKAKFETLFKENSGLRDILENVQRQYWSAGRSTVECPRAASEEFHKLKLDFIVKQMEHLQLLKTFEEVKYQEKLSKKKLSRLEEENADLKAKLKEEEEDDIVMAATMEEQISKLEQENERLKARLKHQKDAEDTKTVDALEEKVQLLQNENMELREALKQLQSQMQLSDSNQDQVHTTTTEEYSHVDVHKKNSLKIYDLRQRINQMVVENEDLKAIIARLRWSEIPVNKPPEDGEEDLIDVLQLQNEVDELRHLLETEQEETKKWKNLYQQAQFDSSNESEGDNSNDGNNYDSNDGNNAFTDWWHSLNLTDLRAIFSGSTMDFNNVLNNIVQKAAESNTAVPEKMYTMLNSTRLMMLDFYKQLVSKWEEMEGMDMKTYSGYSQKLTKKLTETLESSMRKLQQAGEKFANNQKPLEVRLTKLTNKINKLNDWLQTKWTNIKDKYSAEKPVDAGPVEEDVVLDDVLSSEESTEYSPVDENWLVSRAKKRAEQRTEGVDLEGEPNWFIERGKSRQKLHSDDEPKPKAKKMKSKRK